MNLLYLRGGRALNLDLVIEIAERDDPPRSISVEYAFGQTKVLEGEDAEAMRRFLRANSRSSDGGGPSGEAGNGSGVSYALDRGNPGELLPSVGEGG